MSPSVIDQQAELRRRMRAAESAIAAELRRFEAETGIQVRGVDVARFDSGAYGAVIRLGPAKPKEGSCG